MYRILILFVAAAAAAPQDNSITFIKQLPQTEPPLYTSVDNVPTSQDTSDYITESGSPSDSSGRAEATEDTALEESTETTEVTTVTERYVPKTTPKFKKAPPKFYSKLSYFEKPHSSAASPNQVERAGRRRFRSNCRCEKISNCPKLQITVPRCPEEYFLCCF